MALVKLLILLIWSNVAFGSRYSVLSFDGEISNNAAHSNMDPFVKIGDNYYFVSQQKGSWYQALEICRTHGANLATIESAAEMKALQTYLFNVGYRTEGQFFWIDGSDLGQRNVYMSTATGQRLPYLQWGPGQPDHYKNVEFCVEIWLRKAQYDMNDRGCNGARNFICKLPKPKTVALTVW